MSSNSQGVAWRRWFLGPQAAQWRQVGFDPGLVDEDQSCSVNLVLMRLPALPLAGLGGRICFFETQAFGVHKNAAHSRPSEARGELLFNWIKDGHELGLYIQPESWAPAKQRAL